MKKSLFLCVFACFVLTRPVLAANWVTCNEAIKEWDADNTEIVSKCGMNYGSKCYYDTDSGSIDCNHVVVSCKCPSGYSGTCTGTNYSTCYKTCNETCNPNLTPTGCRDGVDCTGFGLNYNTTCSTGKQYYGQSTCTSSGTCHCLYDLTEVSGTCPEGYRDCGTYYNSAKYAPGDVCCKIPAAGTYVKVANGGTVSCAAGYYCPGGTNKKIYYGLTGGLEACPTPGTSATGKSAVTDCYIPSGSSFSDTTGSGVYTGNCYYQ